jgi:hypothetical protein
MSQGRIDPSIYFFDCTFFSPSFISGFDPHGRRLSGFVRGSSLAGFLWFGDDRYPKRASGRNIQFLQMTEDGIREKAAGLLLVKPSTLRKRMTKLGIPFGRKATPFGSSIRGGKRSGSVLY